MKYNHLGFLSKITGPALYKEPLPSAPIEILELSHVYGFAHANDRNTVFFTHSLKPRLSALTTTSTYIHFLSSKVSVTAAIPPKTAGSGPRALVSSIPQDHHAHSQLITTACVHPGGTIIATASGQEIHIREDGEILGILEAPLTVTGSSPGAIDDSPRDDPDAWISAMTFIKNGVILVCAISTKLGTLIHLFDWRRKSLPITSFMGHSDTIFRVIANPWAKREFATVGISHIKWWSFIEPLLGKLPWADGKPPIAEESTPTFFTGIFNSHKLLITGSVFGDIYFWQRNSIQVVCRRMHRGPVYAMVSVPAPYSFLSGGDDARVVVWNEHLQPVNEVSFESIPPIPGQVRAIRSLDICYFDSEGKASGLLSRSATRKFSVAPRRSSKVPAIPDESTSSLFPSLSRTSTFNQPQGNAGRKPSNVRNPHQFQSVSGHCTDNQWEVWGLAAHPIEATKFITVGDDGWAKVWSTQAQCVVFRRHFPNKLRACHYNPNGSVVAIGTDDGLIVVTSPDLKQTEISIKHRKDAIHDLKYSPNSKYLAAGCHDNFIDIYALETPTGFYQRIMCCRGHSCFITHLDWSADSIRLQSNSGNNEIMFWTIDTERASKGGTVAFKDVIWDTTNCVLQWATKGVYELPASSGPGSTQMQLGLRMVTSCERRRRNDVLLVGTTVGDVFLFRYPACTPAPQFKKFPGHGGPISNLVLLQDGTTVISVGAEDGSIFQWTLGGS
ncbi:WD40-repeat-containing domain protein [Polychytrium aggregatum]|uniref:WD40-repeat-containing domain protein n=1 Tax=Polychytrium aggregatum TaxID=110093 RepID=UPI0022FE3B2C|nr:WD40-repeat-containing domain protein [Polychytrium aggregatum]KAI9193626.1 WD40-repeat-containing domain protein [Polychytrium aggregatum]